MVDMVGLDNMVDMAGIAKLVKTKKLFWIVL